MARCRKLFVLAWYSDITYAESEKIAQNNSFCSSLSRKAPLEFCYNGLNYKSQELDYILREAFINVTLPKHTEVEQE